MDSTASRCYWIVISSVIIAIFSALVPSISAENRSPGNKHIQPTQYGRKAYSFSPVKWDPAFSNAGEAGFKWNVGPSTGQNYDVVEHFATSAPNPFPDSGISLAKFNAMVSDVVDGSIMLFSSHAGLDAFEFVDSDPTNDPDPVYQIHWMEIESFAHTTAGLQARDNELATYQSLFSPFQVAPGEINEGDAHYAIGITSVHISGNDGVQYPEMPQLLGTYAAGFSFVCLNGCNTNFGTSAYTDAGARVAIGFTATVLSTEMRDRITCLFQRMNGRALSAMGMVNDKARRVLQRAMGPEICGHTPISGHDMELSASGNTETILAPTVKRAYGPCPLVTDDEIVFELDCKIDRNVIPIVSGVGFSVCSVVVEGLENQNDVVRAKVIPQPDPCYVWQATLWASTVRNVSNSEQLDGNQYPPKTDGVGPNEDDYVLSMDCTPVEISGKKYSVSTTRDFPPPTEPDPIIDRTNVVIIDYVDLALQRQSFTAGVTLWTDDEAAAAARAAVFAIQSCSDNLTPEGSIIRAIQNGSEARTYGHDGNEVVKVAYADGTKNYENCIRQVSLTPGGGGLNMSMLLIEPSLVGKVKFGGYTTGLDPLGESGFVRVGTQRYVAVVNTLTYSSTESLIDALVSDLQTHGLSVIKSAADELTITLADEDGKKLIFASTDQYLDVLGSLEETDVLE